MTVASSSDIDACSHGAKNGILAWGKRVADRERAPHANMTPCKLRGDRWRGAVVMFGNGLLERELPASSAEGPHAGPAEGQRADARPGILGVSRRYRASPP